MSISHAEMHNKIRNKKKVLVCIRMYISLEVISTYLYQFAHV